MTLYPAIDIRGGRAVRLTHGRADAITDYGAPVEMALRWKRQGAEWLHVIDLDGAFIGERFNSSHVHEIVRETGLAVQTGGGIRSMDDIARLLEVVGVRRVVLGTSAFTEPKLVSDAVIRWPGRVAVSIDARDGRVALKGWVEDSDISAIELAKRVRDAGVDTVIYTDINRDGTLSGPNIDATAELAAQLPDMKIIGSGGVSSLADVTALRGAGCAGVILGKALYENRFTLEEALREEREAK